MTYKFVFISILLLLVNCNEPAERQCSDFKTGTFTYTYKNKDGKDVTARFVRNDSIEIDYLGNKVDTVTVRWINDCEYVMRSINPKTMIQKKAVHVKILHTKDNTYTFETKFLNDNSQRKTIGTVTKIQ